MSETLLKERIEFLLPRLNEKDRRQYLALEAKQLGHGGIRTVSEIAGIHRNTIGAGIRELKSAEDHSDEVNTEESGHRVRAAGGGRKPAQVSQPGLKEALLKMVDGETYGDPQGPLSWTTKSTENLSAELYDQGYMVSAVTVGKLLKAEGYSLQQNQKRKQVGSESPDRDAQFRHINDRTEKCLDAGEPVISIDCKKKENIGNFKNTGAEYAPKGTPTEVLDHDFPLKDKGKAVPYGVYDVSANEGYVTVGVSADTSEFAVNSIRSWWEYMGKSRYPDASMIYITCDGGGSNGSRCRLWKMKLQELANELNMPIEVSHFPPGTSKWNRIEHRLFSQITMNWRGRPLTSLETIVSLIANTTTKTGLHVCASADKRTYAKGIKVSDKDLAQIKIVRSAFCGAWNYTIYPN